MRKRAALSEVISSIILSGVVLAVGGALWSYSLGASTVMTDDYVNGTLSLVDELTERFTVEWANVSDTGEALTVWVFNYGDVDITVDVYATVDDDTSSSVLGTPITSGAIAPVDLSFAGDPILENDVVSVQVYSRRQNSAYYTFYN
jgi:hypothetical protein